MSSEAEGGDAGAGDAEQAPPAPPFVPRETVLVKNTYAKHHRSVVRIMAGTNQGTGFVVHNDGTSCLIFTCNHVIAPSRAGNLPLSVKFEDLNDVVSAQVLHAVEVGDLALLRVNGGEVPDCTPLVFSDETELSGNLVVMIGYFGIDNSSVLTTPSSPHGRIMSEAVGDVNDDGHLQCIVCTYTSEFGTSGGPVIMDEDEVVGVHYKSQLGMSLAISAATVKRVLKLWLEHDKDLDITIKEMLVQIAQAHA
ncbi:hypothetical protein ACP70R_006342 [Stipagrostis hirtigluma subsp. patula]